MKPPASPSVRWHRWMKWCAAIPRQRASSRCSSGAASCCSRRAVYREAEAAYAAVTRAGAGDYYEQGLYKQGWSLFKQNLNEESLPLFARLLDQQLLDASAPRGYRQPDSLGRADRELVEDTLRVMSLTFSTEGGHRPAECLRRHPAGQSAVHTAALFAARRPVRGEAALPGCGQHLSRLRGARTLRRGLAATGHAGHRGIRQGRLPAAGARGASASTCRTTTSRPRSGMIASARTTRRSRPD